MTGVSDAEGQGCLTRKSRQRGAVHWARSEEKQAAVRWLEDMKWFTRVDGFTKLCSGSRFHS